MTLTPIATMDNKLVSKPQGEDIHNVKHGYPFYFKDYLLFNEAIKINPRFLQDH